MIGLQPSWRRAWQGLGAAGDGQAVFQQLAACYSEPHRHYHSLQHIGECTRLLETVLPLAVHPAEVEMALWFHDAIYEPRRSDNEEKSAAWAQAALREAGVTDEAERRVRSLIMVTRHSALPATQDEQLVVDVDLSILGAPDERFAEYERQIRQEYAFVPNWLFRRKRRSILRAFLKRPHIYSTAHFRDSLEARARENLQRAVGGLQQVSWR